MATSVADPDLNETDETILKTLERGRNTPRNLADAAGKSRQYVHQRLKILEAADYVYNVGNGVYELDPGELPGEVRDDLAIDAVDGTELRDRLQAALEARDDQRARADRLEDDLADCREQLAAARDADVGIPDRVARGVRAAHTALEGQDPDVDLARGELEAALEALDSDAE